MTHLFYVEASDPDYSWFVEADDQSEAVELWKAEVDYDGSYAVRIVPALTGKSHVIEWETMQPLPSI